MFVVVAGASDVQKKEEAMFWTFDCPLGALDRIKPDDEALEVVPYGYHDQVTKLTRYLPNAVNLDAVREEFERRGREFPPCAERSVVLLHLHFTYEAARKKSQPPLVSDVEKLLSELFAQWELKRLSSEYPLAGVSITTLKRR